MPNETRYLGFRHTTGDASRTPWVGAILVPTGARDLHFASAADEGADWNFANPTHPTFIVHSETTPPTDYLALSHDGTNGYVNAVGGNLALQVSGTTEITIAAATVTLSGADLVLPAASGIIRGSATQSTVSDGDGATDLVPEAQFIGVNSVADGSVLIANYSTTNTQAVAPHLAFLKGGAATQVSTTAVADNEVIGSIIWYGTDGTDAESPVAAIQAVINGTVGTGDMPGSLEFYTTADTGETLTLAFTIDTDQNIYIQNGNGIVVGHTAQITFNALVPEFQVLGSTVGVDGAIAVALYSATAGQGAEVVLGRSKSGTLGTNTIVASGDMLGRILAVGADGGTGFDPAASIAFEVDGTPGAATDMPGRIVFLTSPDGSQTQTESFRVDSSQNVIIGNGNGIVVGHTVAVSGFGVGFDTSEVQVHGTASADSQIAIGRWAADANPPGLGFFKSRQGTIGGAASIISAEDVLMRIDAYGDDGANPWFGATRIQSMVDTTPGAGSMPGRLVFYTTPVGTTTLTERLRIANSGLITVAAGTTPASVATTPGTAHPGSITATGGLGGNTSIATTGVGGIGAGFSFTGGAGGTANSATTAATGGAGGAWATTTGAGGAAAVAGADATGGAGGAITLTTGAGGAVSLAVSGTATGGAAGLITIQGGVGGAVTATTGTNVGGAGGGVSVIAGAGGAASGATDTGGVGGTITITAGAGGNGDTSGAAGAVNITAGAAGTGGNVAGGVIKLTVGAAVGSGATGTMIISGAVLMDDRTITTISTDSDVVYTVAQLRTGVINRDGITANRNDSMPTAANLVAGIPNAEVGTSFFFVLNNNDDASTLTMTTAADGITYDGNVGALAAAASRLYLVVITSVTGSSETATVFGL